MSEPGSDKIVLLPSRQAEGWSTLEHVRHDLGRAGSALMEGILDGNQTPERKRAVDTTLHRVLAIVAGEWRKVDKAVFERQSKANDGALEHAKKDAAQMDDVELDGELRLVTEKE